MTAHHAVLGTGTVGQTIARKLASEGHAVRMGSRSADHPAAVAFATETGGTAATFADAATGAEMIWLCVGGQHALSVLDLVGEDRLNDVVLVDLTNPLDFSEGMPPTLFVQGRDSLAERIQRAAPGARVVKTLNTMSATVMTEPAQLGQDPGEVFLSGEDAAAKSAVAAVLQGWGWPAPLDLGGLDTARGVESWLPLWLRLWSTLGTASFNLKLVRAEP